MEEKGDVVARSMVHLVLQVMYDCRLNDGMAGVDYLRSISEKIADPSHLLLTRNKSFTVLMFELIQNSSKTMIDILSDPRDEIKNPSEVFRYTPMSLKFEFCLISIKACS